MKYKRVLVTHYGGPDELRVVEEECPEPKKGGGKGEGSCRRCLLARCHDA